eukprot:6184551-Pleurochrysis_carterae.AAC.1
MMRKQTSITQAGTLLAYPPHNKAKYFRRVVVERWMLENTCASSRTTLLAATALRHTDYWGEITASKPQKRASRLSFVRERQHVQHRVGRSAEGKDDRNRVLKRLARHDVAARKATLHHAKKSAHAVVDVEQLLRLDLVCPRCGRHGRRVWQRHADGFDHRRHRARGEHGGACARARQREAFELVKLLHVERPRAVSADALHHVARVERRAAELRLEILAVACSTTGEGRSS